MQFKHFIDDKTSSFNFIEILQVWRIYIYIYIYKEEEENVIQWWICQNSHLNKDIK